MTAAAAAASQAQAPVPPPAEQSTADCQRPTYATDRLVCSDRSLRSADRALAAALRGFSPMSSPWLETQPAWFKRRSRCAFATDHRGCVSAAYEERLQVVRSWPAGLRTVAVRCGDDRITRVAFDARRIGLFDQQGALLGVALADAGDPRWHPFVTGARAGEQIALRGESGALRCRQVVARRHRAVRRA